MSAPTTKTIHSILRGLEERSASIDPDTPYEQRSAIRDFYSLVGIARDGECPVYALRPVVVDRLGVSESQASALIRGAFKDGTILRRNAGTATAYLTPELAAEQEREDRMRDRSLISLGARLIGHGLEVAYQYGYRSDLSHDEAISLVRDGKHLNDLTLATPLRRLADLLDEAL